MLRFGTDGIRGVANSEVTPELALTLGRAAARHLAGSPWLLGRDTRRSGPMLLSALAAGLASEGCDVVDVGVIPTPGLAWLAGEWGYPAAMVSASHNPFGDNGIKLLATGGTKLSLEDERAVQDELEALESGARAPSGTAEVGRISSDFDAVNAYVERLVSVEPGAAAYEGSVVVDCANGSAGAVAGAVFSRLGIVHRLVNASPDGTNINSGCGSTHLAALQDEVRSSGASLGIAYDGDADRMLAVDHTGAVVDGDQLIALFAADLQGRGELAGGHVVVTVLSNLGLRIYLSGLGVSLVETPVGDRHVADALELGGYVLGGEQSGHVIFRQHATTGDGVLTSLKLLELLARSGAPLAKLTAESMQRVPQAMVNVPVSDRSRLEGAAAVWSEVSAVEAELGATGRVVIRSSGTEPAVRVMVEAPTADEVERHVVRLAAVVRHELG